MLHRGFRFLTGMPYSAAFIFVFGRPNTTLMPEDAPPTQGPTLTVRSVLIVIAWCVSLCVFAAWMFTLASGYYLLAELINSFKAQLTVLLLACALFLLVLKQRTMGWLLLLVSVWQLLALASIYLATDQPDAGKAPLAIMSINVWGDNKQYQQVVEQIEDVSPDVLLVVEYNNQWHQQLKILHSQYPHRLLEPRWHGYGIGLFSKLPLADTDVWQLTASQTDVPALSAKVKIGSRSLRLAGLHTMSPTSSLRMSLRNDQMDEIAQRLESDEAPTVLMGDFNCTPWSPFFKDLIANTGLRDSRQGKGFHGSWNVDTPSFFWIPIDHAMVSDEVHVHQRWVGAPCGSDHLPLILEVSIAE